MIRISVKSLAAVLLGLLLPLVTAIAAPRIPIGDFFKDLEFTGVSMSPTGEYITVATPVNNRTVLASFRVADMKKMAGWEFGDRSHVDRVVWVGDDRFIMYVSYKEGRYDLEGQGGVAFAASVDGSQRIEIGNGIYYNIVDTTPDDPKTILVERSAPDAFLSKLNVYTGNVVPVATAPLRPGRFLVDGSQNVRFAVGNKDGTRTYTLKRENGTWKEIASSEMGEGAATPVRLTADGQHAYFLISDKGEPDRVVLRNMADGKDEVLIPSQTVDPDGFVRSADRKEILMAHYSDGLPEYKFINKNHPESKTYASLINSFPDKAVSFGGISRDGRRVLFTTYSDTDPGSYYLFDRDTGKATFLLSSMEWIRPETMAESTPISYKARDGEIIHGYLTMPRGVEHRNLPLIMHPHGGPHGPRDNWGFDPEVQYLANLGYAVLQPNFRGSGGYGNAFERKGYRQWGLKMIDDMTDGVRWAVAQGFADPKRVCSYGASYGGYAALQSVVREPDMYKCAIGYVGVYNMDLWLQDSDVADRKAGRAYQRRVFPEDRASRNAQSAGYNIDRIKVPVMLVHGFEDKRVPVSQYEFLKKELEKAGKPAEVTIVERKEGHGFYAYDAQINLYTKMAAFLRKHLGATASNP